MGRAPRKDPPIEYPLGCTLEELYRGANKRMKISRSLLDASGRATQVQETLQVDIKPGWKNRTKVTFQEKGTRPTSEASALAVLPAQNLAGHEQRGISMA